VRLARAVQGEKVLAMPQDALIQTGSSNTALLAEGDGHFKPVNVTAGREFGDWVEVRQGLAVGDQVVTSGQFLIDSEASLRSALPQMAGNGSPAPAASQADAGTKPSAVKDDMANMPGMSSMPASAAPATTQGHPTPAAKDDMANMPGMAPMPVLPASTPVRGAQ